MSPEKLLFAGNVLCSQSLVGNYVARNFLCHMNKLCITHTYRGSASQDWKGLDVIMKK